MVGRKTQDNSSDFIPPVHNFPTGWRDFLKDEFEKEYFQALVNSLRHEENAGIKIYPPKRAIFRVFLRTQPQNIRVVILGQDPYHAEGQAMGLSFSVPEGIKIPPSLRNIYQEIEQDVGSAKSLSGDLSRWEQQGVFLLNASLTVRSGEAASHSRLGWHHFTDSVIRYLGHYHSDIVFLLWGGHAHKKTDLIDSKNHLVLKTVHPSPLSAYRGFLGCGHFSKANQWLSQRGRDPIKW